MDTSKKRYLVAGGFVLYAVLLVVSIYTLSAIGVQPISVLRVVVALLPMLGTVFVLRAAMRFFRRMDELEKRIQLDALAFAYIGTAFVTFGYGFLQVVGLPQVSWFMVWPIMAMLWMLGHVLARRHYRGSGE